MTNINEILRTNTNLNDAIMAVRAEAISSIEDVLTEMDSYDLIDILKDLNDDFHEMDELDDTFDFMSVTEILEELREIDLSDDYFNADSKISGDDPWYVADVDSYYLASQFYDGETDVEPDDDIRSILREAEKLVDAVTRHFKRYDTAKALFEQALKQDTDAVINALWNINQ